MRCWPALFFLLWTGAFAQVPGRGDLRGRVLEDSTGVSNVHLLNLSAEQATISDQEGFFTIPAEEGDTVLVSAIRYERITFHITPEMLRGRLLSISLTPFVNQLDEVVLYPYNLSGDLGRDLGNLPVEEPVTAASLGLPNAFAPVKTQTERMLYEATTGGGIVPLNPVLNAISGRTRMLKKRLARDRAYQQTLEVRARYPDSVFVGQLGVPALRIPDFMYYCEADPSFGSLAEGDPLRMWEFLRKKSAEYRKNNGLEQKP
ncbi:hypothetical protein [Robiginitalea marina]|uniref:Carboxypeptidase-like regulatory domain-containing protein n=1 Tax=Robiginitalea marina TaxID=2954105 RepID=A0ABT1AXR0_9FLAO|nr:hypothetical protein [Robiginitalea marina]MCO5724825.1 hypothetical protein [Robiginitalea marina]